MLNQHRKVIAFAAIMLWTAIVHADPRSDDAKPMTKKPDTPVSVANITRITIFC